MTIKRILSLLLSVIIVSAVPVESPAQIEEATVKVDGLSCPFCAYGLEKKLKKVEGVEKLEIKVDQGVAKLTVKEKKNLSIEDVKKAVVDGGFTPRDIAITVKGRISEHNGRTVLKLAKNANVFLIAQNEQLKKVKEALKGEDKLLRITGTLSKEKVEGHAGHPYVLSIGQFKMLSSATK